MILDLRLGQEDGLDLLREIRSRSDLPVIIITGYSTESSAIEAVNAVPIFVDVDPVALTIDPRLLEAALTPRTKVVVRREGKTRCEDTA